MVKVALVGIGGYGARHLSVLRTLQNYGLCRLCAVVDPFADRQTEVVAGLQSDGIAVYSDLAPVLECDEIEAIFLATPISLHASQTVASLEAGKHVFLEKPPCISLEDFGAMKTAQKRSEKVCAVGFQ